MTPLARHSGAGRNPAKHNYREATKPVVPLCGEFNFQLDSGLRRNDGVLK
jgi:hypothetical protein